MGHGPRNRRERRAAGQYRGFAKGKGKASEHWMAEVQREKILRAWEEDQARRPWQWLGIVDEAS
jgi:hypothetical protein